MLENFCLATGQQWPLVTHFCLLEAAVIVSFLHATYRTQTSFFLESAVIVFYMQHIEHKLQWRKCDLMVLASSEGHRGMKISHMGLWIKWFVIENHKLNFAGHSN